MTVTSVRVLGRAGVGLLAAVPMGIAVAPKALPDLGPAPTVDPAAATATFVLRLVIALLCAYVAVVLVAVIAAGLRPVPVGLRRRLVSWTGRGPAAGIRRAIGAGALGLGLLPLAPATALAAPPPAAEPPTMAPIPAAAGSADQAGPPAPTAPAPGDRPAPSTSEPSPAPTFRPAADDHLLLGATADPEAGRHGAATPPTTPPTLTPTAGGSFRTGRSERADELAQPGPPAPTAAVSDPRTRPPGGPDHLPPTAGTLTVRPGDDFWSLTEALVRLQTGRPPRDHEIIGPWRRLIEANRDVLTDPDDPNLLLPGTVLRLPAR